MRQAASAPRRILKSGPVEVTVSYAGEMPVEEAVNRYLAARENARTACGAA